MLKPGGSLSFAVGNLSSAAGIGGGATGASLAAASLSAGRPIRGEPGGSAGAAAGAAAVGGFAGCCAAAPHVNTPIKAPASNKLRGTDELIIMKSSPCVEALNPCAGNYDAGAGGLPGRHSPIFSGRCAIGNILARRGTQGGTGGINGFNRRYQICKAT